jgi:hypothetical protein
MSCNPVGGILVKFLTAIFVVVTLMMIGSVQATTTATAESTPRSSTYQGKTAFWWAKRAVQARKDANARAHNIKQLKRILSKSPTIRECIKLATIAYPIFTERRAWQIIKHESWMTRDPVHAKNPHSTASGLYQFLTSTFYSTPYGKAGMSIWDPCAQSLAAGWMHSVGRGREWAIGTGISGD